MSLKLHPELHLPKSHWSRHTLLQGSVGSGKTQIMLPIIEQIIRADHKLFLFDTKGDFTSYFKKPIIVCPFDERSYVWDIAADCRYPLQAAMLAEILIPGNADQKNGDFWTMAARQLLVGAIRSLQAERPLKWTFADLAELKNRNAEDMLPTIQEHFATATSLVENTESQTTASLLSTLVAQTKLIDDLAMAWPVRKENRRFSITEWAQDGYKGRKQVIVQSGPEEAMTKAYISALVNLAVPEIISPKLPDAEKDRFIGFVFDELATAGRLNIGPLIDKGRSKGVVFIGCYQNIAQVAQVYGDKFAETMSSMVGTHVICQLQIGETREKAAQQLGKHRVAYRTHDDNAVVHEESRALISPGELTDRLGPRKGKQYGPHGFGVRAIVQMGGDPLLLDFPGVVMKTKRPGQIPARWMTQPHQRNSNTPALPAPTQVAASSSAQPKRVGMTKEEIDQFFRE
ncbi:type IV secretion system DNA-binding domain-containing protein [Stenotrophomonas sp. NY11291]|uniref:type IV secretion system DNA-binding domain-containing protein n=1 Tax=Stenotrophomonas sp. NY11291 TaxID=2939415 RepID=UPI00200E7C65|nr:type IV secretion system DNA-binding domain-containing protein [Stenotrophomonas sp. NY11291]UQA24432.1 type IV secretion system DNA-binding domain-containing protein [Stenotrophomonas sp. NY11291]